MTLLSSAMVVDRDKEWVAVVAHVKRFCFQDDEVSRMMNLTDKVEEQTILMRKN
jgi:hypothetical protein